MTRINFLPWRQALAERRRKYFLMLLAAFACVALAAVWLADQVIELCQYLRIHAQGFQMQAPGLFVEQAHHHALAVAGGHR